jgi:hypothetical protein
MEQTTQKYIEFIYTCICKMIRNSGLTQWQMKNYIWLCMKKSLP